MGRNTRHVGAAGSNVVWIDGSHSYSEAEIAGLRLHHPLRQARRDATLWKRELKIAKHYQQERITCPCSDCRGCRRSVSLATVESHLRKHGRDPMFRVWKGPGHRDESDVEWEEDFESRRKETLLVDSGMRMDDMLHDYFGGPKTIDGPDGNTSGIGVNNGHDADNCNIDSGQDAPYGNGSTPNDNEAAGTHGKSDKPVENEEKETKMRDETEMTESLAKAFEILDVIKSAEDSEEAVSVSVDEDVTVGEGAPPAGPSSTKPSEEAEFDAEFEEQLKKLKEANVPLFKGARCTKLSATLSFMTLCSIHGASNKFVDEMLALLSRFMLPAQNNMPLNMYYAKVITKAVGLHYNAIDACADGCALFTGRYASWKTCPRCGKKRFKQVGNTEVPKKVLRHFPVIPRLKRLYRSPTISNLLEWHAENMSRDGLVRHVADGRAWKHVNDRWKDFGLEPRNIRFGLALDGVNPFSEKLAQWSTWPVFLIIYNLPPWMSTKKFFMMLALIIPGKESVSMDNIDVYLKPLIQELYTLWSPGVLAIDCRKERGSKSFTLRAVLLWTISDFPGLGLVSGCAHGGYAACHICGPSVTSRFSKELNKCVYEGNRRNVGRYHPYRHISRAKKFNNHVETLGPAPEMQYSDIVQSLQENRSWELGITRTARSEHPSKRHGVKRRSILYDLPYFKDLLVRHSLDVMHIEKNVGDSLIGFLFGEKDTAAVRRDMEVMKIRPHLWLTKVTGPKGGSKWMKPAAPYVLKPKELEVFKNRLLSIKVPSGFSSSLGKHVADNKLTSMKAHDWHILLHQIIPFCIRGLLNEETRVSILRLCRLFRRMCSKIIDPREEQAMMDDVAETMCMIEMCMPPAIFDMMYHLVRHAIKELFYFGPVHVRWMYSVERMNKVMKSFVRNMARPEACMAEAYLLQESIGYATEYMQDFEPVSRRVWDADEEEGVVGEELEGSGVKVTLILCDIAKAHLYVLMNTSCMTPWIRLYEEEKASFLVELESSSMTEFPPVDAWIRKAVKAKRRDSEVESEVVSLSVPPLPIVLRFPSMKAYGNHYCCQSVDPGGGMESYDCGVATGFHHHVRGLPSTDLDDLPFVGILQDIYVLDYGPTPEPITVMRAHWVKKTYDNWGKPSYRRHKDNFLLANFVHLKEDGDDPFVFPSQVEQVFFCNENKTTQWKTVLHNEPRSRRVQSDQYSDFISTSVAAVGSEITVPISKMPECVDMSSAVELNELESALAELPLQ